MPDANGSASKVTKAGTQQPDTVHLIAAEIRSLRKGRGVHTPDLDKRLGPHLRELASGANGGTAADRQALITKLNGCATALADDLRTAITASLGLSAETMQMEHFKDRIVWLAAHLDRDYRTALRRVDAAEKLFAESIAGELNR